MATIPDKVNTGALATIVAVGAISMVGISAALTAMVRSEVDHHADQVGAKSDLGPVRKLRGIQEAELHDPKPDPTTGRAVVPIERAMDLVVEDLRQHPEHATAPAPADAGKKNDSEDAGAPADPAAGEAGGAIGEETGAVPTEGTPAEPTGGAQPAEGQPAVGGSEPAPAPGDPGAAPAKPETGNGKTKNKGARHAKAEPAVAPASPPAPTATP